MDLASPITSAIPSMEGLVLEVLARTNAPLTLSAIHRLMSRSGSVSGVRNSLLRLTAQGIVDDVPGGYVLNRQHLASGSIIGLATMRAQLHDRIAEHVGSWDPEPLLVGLFGSAARRDGDAQSDIDVLVVTTQRELEVGDLAHAIERWTGNECHVVAVTPADLRRMRRAKEPILQSWREELVVVMGDAHVLAGK